MTYINVQIVRFIDDRFPGFVECHLTDVHGRCWVINEKIPVVSEQYLHENTDYPVPGFVSCQVLERCQGIARIDTSKPLWIESVEGETVFEVAESLLTQTDQHLF